jgi:hypothetical protein
MNDDLTRAELDVARERISRWPKHEREALTQLTEEEARAIALLTALLDITPVDEIPAGAIHIDLRSAPAQPTVVQTDASVLPYRANEHPAPAHEGAEKTVAREGAKHMVSPGSHRHKLLRCFAEAGQMTLIEAGQYALREHGVGAGTIIQWDEGRRRSSELAEFGLLDCVHESTYAINHHGRVALQMCDDGKRWTSSGHDWGVLF